MKVKISKWGNSLAVRPSKAFGGRTQPCARQGRRDREGRHAPDDRNRAGAQNPALPLEDLLAQIKPGQVPPPLEDWGILKSEWPAEDWSDIAPTDAEWEAWKKEAEERGELQRRRRS